MYLPCQCHQMHSLDQDFFLNSSPLHSFVFPNCHTVILTVKFLSVLLTAWQVYEQHIPKIYFPNSCKQFVRELVLHSVIKQYQTLVPTNSTAQAQFKVVMRQSRSFRNYVRSKACLLIPFIRPNIVGKDKPRNSILCPKAQLTSLPTAELVK